ncbi:MAG: SGNH/GDSL hydrolase family protein, partial [Pseudomonadota bacterium]
MEPVKGENLPQAGGFDHLIGTTTNGGPFRISKNAVAANLLPFIVPDYGYDTKADMDADLSPNAGQTAGVYLDGANNGVYKKVGASGTGSWSFERPFPEEIAEVTMTGDADAFVATSQSGQTSYGVDQLFVGRAPAANANGAFTVAVNGQPALSFKSSDGTDPAANSVKANMPLFWIYDGSQYVSLQNLNLQQQFGVDILNTHFRDTQIIGRGIAPEVGVTTYANTFTFTTPVARDGALVEVSVWASGAGSIKIHRFNSSFVLQETKTLSLAAGSNVLTVDDIGEFTLKAGDHLAYYSSVAKVTLQTCTGPGLFYFTVGDTTTVNHSNSASNVDAMVQLKIGSLDDEVVDHMDRAAPGRRVPFHLGDRRASIPAGASAAASAPYLNMEPVPRDGRITACRVHMADAGPLQLVLFDRVGDTLFRNDGRYGFDAATGSSTIPLDIPVKKGQYVGLASPTSELSLTSGDRFEGRGYVSVPGSSLDISRGVTATVTTTNPHFGFDLELEAPDDRVSRHVIDLKTASSITVIGNSYETGSFQPGTKGWVQCLSAMLDHVFHNFSVSSNDAGLRLDSIRQGHTSWYFDASFGNRWGTTGGGVTFRGYNSDFAIIVLGTNSPNVDDITKDTSDLIETVMACGSKPILMTENFEVTPGQMAAYRQLADQYGVPFIDLNSNAIKFPVTYAGFVRSLHYNYRVALAHYSVPAARALKRLLGSPESAIKLYHPHPDLTPASIDDLIYDRTSDLNGSLQSKWTEISLGSAYALSGDANVAYMDEIDDTGSYSAPGTQSPSDYLNLAADHPLSFSDYALCRVFINAAFRNVQEVKLFVGSSVSTVKAMTAFGDTYASQGQRVGFWKDVPVRDGYAILNGDDLNGSFHANGEVVFAIVKAGSFNLQDVHVEWVGIEGRNDDRQLPLAR